ncbi:DM13 domain-containing protein [Pseudarthrobacter sp. NS4]|uniref:DM13 domain-containing protein n=1 Tax=Pseudarthrobacter sp. NS4 TaxID=2973976 RepID=UPI002163208B|nr:DM13 domain-containing protein [Pseudarthrobacter sp. NS4]
MKACAEPVVPPAGACGLVVEGTDGWFTAGSAGHYDLGLLKGNQGNQVYEIPAGVDLSKYPSVDLWCVQFSVSFGATELVA